VKFVRDGLADVDLEEWLRHILSDEAPKAQELARNGAKSYILITNRKGTAYPASGSIDRVQKHLDEYIPIPAQCWWRDDLNRRLDTAWDIKWSYPELLTGIDIIRYIVESGFSEDTARRTLATKAFYSNSIQS